MSKILLTALALAASPVIANAQSTPAGQTAATATPVDPARLTAAKALLDELMPPDRRNAMLEGMLRPMMANIQQGLLSDPEIAKQLKSTPQARPILESYLRDQTDSTMALLRQNMPGMIDAMAHAYARRFDMKQLGELQAFFATPTGRAYMEQSMQVMSDTDVSAWQRSLMQQSMQKAQADAQELAKKLKAIAPNEGKSQ